jgi:hypothetical protein
MSQLDEISARLPPTVTRLTNYVAIVGPTTTPLEVLDMDVTDDPFGRNPFLLVFSAPDDMNFNTAADPNRKRVLAFVYAYWVLQTIEQATVMFKESDVPPDMLTAGVDWMTMLTDDGELGRPHFYSQPFPFDPDPLPTLTAIPLPTGINTLCEIQRDKNKNQKPERIQSRQETIRALWRNSLLFRGLVRALIILGVFAAFALVGVWFVERLACAINICPCPCNADIVAGSIVDIPDCGVLDCGAGKKGPAGVAGKEYLVRGCRCETVLVNTCCGTVKPVTDPAPTPGETAGAVALVLVAVAAAAVVIGGVYLATRQKKGPPPPSTVVVTSQPPAPPMQQPGAASSPSLATRAGQGAGRVVVSTRRGISEFVSGAKTGAKEFP